MRPFALPSLCIGFDTTALSMNKTALYFITTTRHIPLHVCFDSTTAHQKIHSMYLTPLPSEYSNLS